MTKTEIFTKTPPCAPAENPSDYKPTRAENSHRGVKESRAAKSSNLPAKTPSPIPRGGRLIYKSTAHRLRKSRTNS